LQVRTNQTSGKGGGRASLPVRAEPLKLVPGSRLRVGAIEEVCESARGLSSGLAFEGYGCLALVASVVTG
jgi:hypothetical protein